jgi:BirA family biotin operon repressor/biotin-[acetyl-CoA-carboxylase] ligase
VILAPGRSVAPSRALPLVTIAAGVALAEAIARSTGLQPTIKWPNDLLVGGLKLAGILAEALPVTPGAAVGLVVLGYGINVARSSFPIELRDRVTAIETELGRAVDRLALFAETLARLAARYADLLEGRFDAILDAWQRLAPGCRGTRVTWHASSGPRSGTTAGIDDQGGLLVTTDAGTERIVAGEVFWHL